MAGCWRRLQRRLRRPRLHRYAPRVRAGRGGPGGRWCAMPPRRGTLQRPIPLAERGCEGGGVGRGGRWCQQSGGTCGFTAPPADNGGRHAHPLTQPPPSHCNPTPPRDASQTATPSRDGWPPRPAAAPARRCVEQPSGGGVRPALGTRAPSGGGPVSQSTPCACAWGIKPVDTTRRASTRPRPRDGGGRGGDLSRRRRRHRHRRYRHRRNA